ncbi:hypothetical protein [Bacillus sp. AFS040349]|uniref:hypothetical protein n=1 Tax=Bacillus sp. AFS040349 TaxID=2033502 RepID=UPI000BFBB478|nr:hypothetical protein [Bacillus sp. AFS040349]PGT83285.1 hypothetical protein COD11_13195 [Bacillus sp. AFS040349]
MKISLFMFKLSAVKMFKPELEKGERNPYTKGDEIGNPYMKDIKLDIKEEDVKEVLQLLEGKGYDVSNFKP